MARRVDEAVWKRWRQRIARQPESGLTVAAFCEKEGVSSASFYAWKRKLAGPGSSRPATRAARGPRSSGAARATSPAPAGAAARGVGSRRATSAQARAWPDRPGNGAATGSAADFLRVPVRSVRSSPWIELTLIDGTVVRLPQENLAALTVLLRALRGDEFDAGVREG